MVVCFCLHLFCATALFSVSTGEKRSRGRESPPPCFWREGTVVGSVVSENAVCVLCFREMGGVHIADERRAQCPRMNPSERLKLVLKTVA